jgi:hypothetical protein
MKVLFVFLFGLSALHVNSQSEKIIAKFCPLALADVNMPTIQAGFEVKLLKNVTWYNEFGVKYTKNIVERYVDTSVVPSNGYKIKSEFRYYLMNKGTFQFEGAYFAANVFFVKDMYNRQISYRQNGIQSININDFGVDKNVLGFNAVFGYQRNLAKKVFFEAYGGLGIRLRNISTVREEFNKNTDVLLNATDPKINTIGEKGDVNGGFSFRPNLTLGFRIGFGL